MRRIIMDKPPSHDTSATAGSTATLAAPAETRNSAAAAAIWLADDVTATARATAAKPAAAQLASQTDVLAVAPDHAELKETEAAAATDAAAAETNNSAAATTAADATTPAAEMHSTCDAAPVAPATSVEEKQLEQQPQHLPTEPAQAAAAASSNEEPAAILPAAAAASNEPRVEEDTEMEPAPAAPIEPPLPDSAGASESQPLNATASPAAVPSDATSDARMADPASEAQTEVLDASGADDAAADIEPPASFPFPSLGSPTPSTAAVEESTVACVVPPAESQPLAPLRTSAPAAVTSAVAPSAADSPSMPPLESLSHPFSPPHAQSAQSYATLIRVKLELAPMETAQLTIPSVPAEPEASRKRKNTAASAFAPPSSAAAAVPPTASSASRTPSKSQKHPKSNGPVDLVDDDGDGSKGARKKKKTTATASAANKSKGDSSAADKENSHTAIVASYARPGSAAATAAAAALAASNSLDFETLSQTEEAARSRQHAAEQLRQHNATLASAQAAAAASGLSVTGQQQTGNDCIICQTAYTSHGSHRLCCLKCGHLFGRNCVEHWLSQHKSCPTCKKVAHKIDLRNLFAPASGVVVADSAHMQAMQDKLQNANTELVKQKLLNAQLNDDVKKLNARWESLVVAHQSLQHRVMRTNGSNSAEKQLTYIMSPTIQPAGAAAAAPSSRPLSPSQFQYISLPQSLQAQPQTQPQPQTQASASSATMFNNLQAAAPRASHIPPFSGHHLPVCSQSHAPASSAAFLHPQGAAAAPAPAPPVASSSAPILPAMQSKPAMMPGSNEMQFPLAQMFAVEGGRVMDFDNANTNLLLSACPPQYASTVANGLTHGVMKLAVSDVNCRYFMPLHSKPIRELKYHAGQQLLLSASFDKTLKLSDITHGSIVATWDLPQPAWSATWNSWNDSYVHVGLQSGELLTFDIRMNQTVPLFSLQLPSKQPVHSLFSIGNPSDPEDCMRGLIAGTTAHVSFWKASSNLKHWNLHDLPLIPTQRTTSASQPGPSCSSVAFDAVSSSVLCSLRPSSVTVPAPASIPGANGYTLAKPQSPMQPMCTVFKLGSDQNASQSAGASAASASPPKANARFTLHVPASNRIAFEVSRVPVPATDVSCSCVAQLLGHRIAASLTRSAIFTQTGSRGSSRLLVAIGDDDSNQCIVWDATTERVLSRLSGQPSAITQVHHSATLGLMATLSNSTCCLYSTAMAAD